MTHKLYLIIILILALIATTASASEMHSVIKTKIITIAKKHELDPNLLLAVCYHESRFKYFYNVNDGGSPSYGPCQIKEIAAKQVNFTKKAMSTEDTIEVAAKYLKYNLNRCKSIKSGLAAYNTGKCIQNPRPKGYVDTVLGYYDGLNQGKRLRDL